MIFPTMWYVRPAKAQTSLIRAFRSFFYKKSKQVRVPTFVYSFYVNATTAKGPGCGNLR